MSSLEDPDHFRRLRRGNQTWILLPPAEFVQVSTVIPDGVNLYLIEAAFREMKSVLRPWFVYKREHVQAHYTICVLAYALEKMIDLMLEDQGCKSDGWTLGQLKEETSKYRLIELAFARKSSPSRLQQIPETLTGVLKKLGLQACLKAPTASNSSG